MVKANLHLKRYQDAGSLLAEMSDGQERKELEHAVRQGEGDLVASPDELQARGKSEAEVLLRRGGEYGLEISRSIAMDWISLGVHGDGAAFYLPPRRSRKYSTRAPSK